MDKVTRQNAANAEVLKSQADEMRFVLKQLMAMVDGKNGQVRLGIRPHPALSVKPCQAWKEIDRQGQTGLGSQSGTGHSL